MNADFVPIEKPARNFQSTCLDEGAIVALPPQLIIMRLDEYAKRRVKFSPAIERRRALAAQFNDWTSFEFANQQIGLMARHHLRLFSLIGNKHPRALYNGNVGSIAVIHVEFCRVT